MNLSQFAETMNCLGREEIPFLFVVDFEMSMPQVYPLSEIQHEEILYFINGVTNAQKQNHAGDIVTLKKFPASLFDYQKKFDKVYESLAYGDSFLTNLTVKTEVKLSAKLRDIFFQSQAKYKLFFKNKFLVFSPETFVQIKDGEIFSFPMKGTIDASIENAKEKILSDKKELAEHVTIVDLIRNDLSQVAYEVKVLRFRYLDEVRSASKNLLQVSSEIRGKLPSDYQNSLGNILLKLLPAGSVSGAPKRKTLEIIQAVEGEARGYYTGVFGYFNGRDLDSGVMIRFIENNHGKYFYRSGGGITTQSVVEAEYKETIDKVYVPVA